MQAPLPAVRQQDRADFGAGRARCAGEQLLPDSGRVGDRGQKAAFGDEILELRDLLRGRVAPAGGLERDGQVQGEEVEKLRGLLVELRAADPAQAEHAARLLAGLQRRIGVAIAGRGVGRKQDVSRAHRLFALLVQLHGVRPSGHRACPCARPPTEHPARRRKPAARRRRPGNRGTPLRARATAERAGRSSRKAAAPVSSRVRDCARKDLLRAAPSVERARDVRVLRSCGSNGLRRKSTAPRRIPSSAYSSAFDAAMTITCVSGNISLIFASNWMPSSVGIASVITRSAGRWRSCRRAPATESAVSAEYPSPRSSATECAAQGLSSVTTRMCHCKLAGAAGDSGSWIVTRPPFHVCLLPQSSAFSAADLAAAPRACSVENSFNPSGISPMIIHAGEQAPAEASE